MATYGNGQPVFCTEDEEGYYNSPEYVAAMYESYAADWESAGSRMGRNETPEIAFALDAYARTAHRLCEEIEYDEYDRTCRYCGRVHADQDTLLYHLEFCGGN